MTRHVPPRHYVRPHLLAYRKFPSRWHWNSPRIPAWIGWTIGLRVGAVLAVAYVLVTNWPS